ncbi:MAG: hypothetical protein J0I09_00640 [Sphingobacteriia bacterium]|nr:hypothetical protein [Sphingobacteriia bacterium]
MQKRTILFFLLITAISCRKSEPQNPCANYDFSTNKTKIEVLESLLDSSFTIPDTAYVGSFVGFRFIQPYPISTNIYSIAWNINNGSYTTGAKSFSLAFKDPGTYTVQLIITYTPRSDCDNRKLFSDTVIKKLTIVPLINHTSAFEGSYRGFLDTRPADTFTISINYFKLAGDALGDYYLYNYVKGCTGDYLYWNLPIPPGTGYLICWGYKNFNLKDSYPCLKSSDFKGYGYLNKTNDSIFIKHYGYNNAMPAPGDTIPRWHFFRGRRI